MIVTYSVWRKMWVNDFSISEEADESGGCGLQKNMCNVFSLKGLPHSLRREWGNPFKIVLFVKSELRQAAHFGCYQGRLKARTRRTAICARLTGSSGQ